MATVEGMALSLLYEQDETAWLEAMSALAASGRYEQMDHPHLSEYLADMANRDRREVFSRLVVLFTHLLKWEHQPEHRSGSWHGTIREQRRELRQLCESATLRNFAETVLADAYAEAQRQAADETGLALDAFPKDDARSLDELLTRARSSGGVSTIQSIKAPFALLLVPFSWRHAVNTAARRGFSIVDLLVTVVVIATLLAMFAPAMHGARARSAVEMPEQSQATCPGVAQLP